jgi:hypothetical protein
MLLCSTIKPNGISQTEGMITTVTVPAPEPKDKKTVNLNNSSKRIPLPPSRGNSRLEYA